MALVNCPIHGLTYEKTCLRCKEEAHKFIYRSEELPENDPFTAESYIRKPLLDFTYEMEDKLRKNDHKKGWRELPVEALFKMLMVEIEEFKIADEFFGPEEAAKELVDVANFCMMLADRLKVQGKHEDV